MLRFASLLLCLGSIGLLYAADAPKPDEGVLPVGVDGKPLNLDFETGTLKDWTAEGDAFVGQPIKGDVVAKRRGDMKSNHQGNYWIGGFEIAGDKPTGTLTSVAFKVTHPWGSFLVGGGPHANTCVELVRKDTNAVFFRASGLEEENLRRVVVDLKPHADKEIFIRLVDKHTGHWGHLNFDDFRFHKEKPALPERPRAMAPDVLKHAGLAPLEAAAAMTVPEQFSVKLFAGEPDIQQPIAMCFDDRGRLWVAEAYSYPIRRPEKEAKDRILIFEDENGDGKFTKRTVFMEGLNLVSGLEVGFGGVWIGAAPYLMYVPIKEGEDKPAGPAVILLDGWGYQDTHETLNTFSWGPDGWLYGCHGVFTHSRVGKPGTADALRTPINAGVWRYHPVKHVFEVFANGTSNPWGFDFNEFGQGFCEACVIPHAFHIIQNARYHRQGGVHFNPHTYDDIKTIADHFHYIGATPHGGNERSDGAGGGHAHCGTMIYLGGAWPDEYRNRMFMGNIHGRRLNVDILNPKGSGYVASHGPDFLLANDAWARFINMRYGPDGNVYLIDWYDKQACHHGDPNIWDRSNGRIYKISYRGTKPVHVDLQAASDKQLVEMMLNKNDWFVRHARRILQERKPQPDIHDALAKIAFNHADETRRLRGLWALHATGGLTDERINQGLSDAGPYVRGWTIQLALENGKASPALLAKMNEMAQNDPSPIVRLYLSSALQRLPLADRWEIGAALAWHAEDAKDHNLPLMIWYGVEPLAELDAPRALALASKARIPLLSNMVRRIASIGTIDSRQLLVTSLGKTNDSGIRTIYLHGILEGLKGRRQVDMPKDWPTVFTELSKSENADIRNQATSLAVTFGDPRALDEMLRILKSTDSGIPVRQNALAVLLGAKEKRLAPVLQQLLDEKALRGPALKGLAAYDDPKTPEVLLKHYPTFNSEEKRDALNTLASRPNYAKALLDAIGNKKVATADVSADIIRQIGNLKNADLDKRVGEVWGIVRTTPADRLKMIADYRKLLQTPTPVKPDLAHGRAVFAKTCQQCHTLYGIGNKVGPDITGSNRANLEYLLENILDPSAVIPKEYAASVFNMADGRTITGIVRSETPAAFTVVTANETLTLPKGDVERRTDSPTSMMPDDQFKLMPETDIRALIAYLQYPTQVPMLANDENAKDFFNGKDLAGWYGNMELWKVDNGEIVGKTTGLKHNEFLKSHLMAGDFRLMLKIKLTPNKENSGVQFRSEALPNGDVKGYQADVGLGWWGKLYEEHGREILSNKPGDPFVKAGQWNDYEIIAVGSKIKTFINGNSCVDIDDPAGAKRGIFAFQIHSGGAMEVRFKDLKLELNPKMK